MADKIRDELRGEGVELDDKARDVHFTRFETALPVTQNHLFLVLLLTFLSFNFLLCSPSLRGTVPKATAASTLVQNAATRVSHDTVTHPE